MIIKFLLSLFFSLSVVCASAQYIKDIDLDKLTLSYAKASFSEFRELLAIPNDAHFPDDLEKNLIWCEDAFSKRGFETERLTTSVAPLLLANRNYPNAKRTVLVYLQIDGQPVDTSKWDQNNPYEATLKELVENGMWHKIPWNNLEGILNPEWRIFARSTSDSKGEVMMFLKAMDIINDYGYSPNYNIKVIYKMINSYQKKI